MFSSRPKKSRRPPQEPAPELPPEKSSSSKAERASRLDGEDTSRVKKKSGLKEERHGLFVLHPGTKQDRVKADIIALHGLGGDAFKTWTDKQGHLWLRDSLPGHIPDARIMAFGYDSATWSGSKSTILEFALDLLERIRIVRQTLQEKSRSIIFICHSLGGLVCKKALVVAHEQPQYAPILEKVQGIVFMGTPHRGSKLAGLAKPLSNIINLALIRKRIRSDLLSNLEISSNTITEITMSAVHRLAPLEIVSFYEQKILDPLGCRVVEPFSAILGLPNEKALPIAADHRSMARFSPHEKEKYRPVWTAIAELVENSQVDTQGSADWNEARSMLDLLFCADYGRFLLDAPNAHPGSCSWIFEDKKFSKWLNGDGSGVFWLYGHPGRGKTVLARFLVENLKTVSDNYPQLNPARSARVIHYLFLEQDKERNSATVVLRSLLHQLLLEDPAICHVIQHYFDLERRTQYPERDSIALWNAFRGVLDLNRLKEVTIVLDGLDELDFGNLTSILGGLATTIKSMNDRLPDHKLKLILSSRPNMTIMETLERKEVTPSKMEIDTRKGVESFITSEVNSFGSAHTFPEDLSRNIINEILEKADGMFLWASLAWTNFREGVTLWNRRTIEKQLRSLEKQPPGLASLYSSLLAKIDPLQIQELKLLFQCIIAAQRPLSSKEMAEALAVHDNSKYHSSLDIVFSISNTIETTCPNFVTFDNNGTIRFSHQSVKDFFLDGIPGISLDNSHIALAAICITYLNFKDLPALSEETWDEWQKKRDGFPLLNYASGYLYQHMDYVPHEDHKWIEFRHLILERKCHLQWGDHRVPLTQAIYRNSRILVTKFLEAGCDIDERFFGGPPLHYAILEGKMDIAELLLDKGAAPNLQDHHKRSPLHLAIQNGQNNLIERLMRMDTVDLNIRDSDGRTPLHWAVMGISDDLLSRLLKDSRVDVSIVDNDQRSALTYAAYWGHEKGVRTILENSTSLEQHREGELSPVICTAQQGWKDLTLELVTRVPNINQHRGRDRKGLLHWVAIYDWDEVIQVAVDKAGAKLNQIDSSGKTPLHYAAELGNHSATRRLVRCGASVRINDNAGKTAIQGAAMEGFADVLNLLLQESDYDVNEKDNQGCTLLHWAASWDWASIMRIVVDQPDVNLSQRNGYGRTALHIAALCGCPNVMKVLLELDHYDINQTDAFGNTLLHLGARIGSVNVSKEVLSYPLFDRNRQNEFGQSALNVADTYDKSKEVCALLREAGVRYGRARRVENPVRDSYVPDAPGRREPSDPNKALVIREQISAVPT